MYTLSLIIQDISDYYIPHMKVSPWPGGENSEVKESLIYFWNEFLVPNANYIKNNYLDTEIWFSFEANKSSYYIDSYLSTPHTELSDEYKFGRIWDDFPFWTQRHENYWLYQYKDYDVYTIQFWRWWFIHWRPNQWVIKPLKWAHSNTQHEFYWVARDALYFFYAPVPSLTEIIIPFENTEETYHLTFKYKKYEREFYKPLEVSERALKHHDYVQGQILTHNFLWNHELLKDSPRFKLNNYSDFSLLWYEYFGGIDALLHYRYGLWIASDSTPFWDNLLCLDKTFDDVLDFRWKTNAGFRFKEWEYLESEMWNDPYFMRTAIYDKFYTEPTDYGNPSDNFSW